MAEDDESFNPDGWSIFSCGTIFGPPEIPMIGGTATAVSIEPPVTSQLIPTTKNKEMTAPPKPSPAPVIHSFVSAASSIFNNNSASVKKNPKDTLKSLKKLFPENALTIEVQIINRWFSERDDAWFHEQFTTLPPEGLLPALIIDIMRVFDSLNPSGVSIGKLSAPTKPAASSKVSSKAPLNPDEIVDLDDAQDRAANDDEKLAVAQKAQGAAGRRAPSRKPRGSRRK